MARKTFKALFSEARKQNSYWVARATQDFTDELYQLMGQRGINKTDLARRIGTSPAYVTKALGGNTNFTMESMVTLVRALDGQLNIHISCQEHDVRWFDLISSQPIESPKSEYELVDRGNIPMDTDRAAT